MNTGLTTSLGWFSGVLVLQCFVNQMVSVRQALTLKNEEREPAWVSDKPPPEDWPNRGSITFSSTSLLAGPDGPHLLRDINVHIKSKEKVSVLPVCVWGGGGMLFMKCPCCRWGW